MTAGPAPPPRPPSGFSRASLPLPFSAFSASFLAFWISFDCFSKAASCLEIDFFSDFVARQRQRFVARLGAGGFVAGQVLRRRRGSSACRRWAGPAAARRCAAAASPRYSIASA